MNSDQLLLIVYGAPVYLAVGVLVARIWRAYKGPNDLTATDQEVLAVTHMLIWPTVAIALGVPALGRLILRGVRK